MATEIPRALHQIWIGPNPIPDQHRLWMEGWKRAHPAWSYRLWRDDEIIPRLPAAALEMFRAANSHAGKADVARVWLVHQLGGVYVDTDFECLRPIDDLLVGC